MANHYVRSTDGNDADDGSTWALAKAKLTGASLIESAGDTINVSSASSDTTSSGITMTFAGTNANPVKILSVNDSAEPPTTLAAGGTVSTTGASSITINGSIYVHGMTFNCGTGANNLSMSLNATAGSVSLYESCNFNMVATGASCSISTVSGFSNGRTDLKNCNVKFGNSGQRINVNRGIMTWEGGGIASGGTSPATLFSNGGTNGRSEVYCSGLDLSNASSSINIFTAGSGGTYMIRNSKLPDSWSGSLCSGTFTAGERAEMWNCDSGDTNYRMWVEDIAGSAKSETTLVKTGGASDGDTAHSWKMASSSSCIYPGTLLRSPEVSAWNSTTGSSITVTVDILHDSATNLKDNEIWLDVQYLSTSGRPLSARITDAKADVLATAADQTTSSATWTTTGMSNPNKQKLSVTFTPQEKGYIQARVCMGKASYTVYVDPELQVS